MQVQSGGIHLKAFPQLIFAKLNHYVIATLENRKCDAAVINVGINVTCWKTTETLIKTNEHSVTRCQNSNISTVLFQALLVSLRLLVTPTVK